MMIDMIGPLDVPSQLVRPDDYDVMLSDIKPSDLPDNISKVMGTVYLSPTNTHSTWPLKGKVWGYNRRILVTLPVSSKERCVNVHFIFETGAPASYISPEVLNALDVEEWQLGTNEIRLNGIRSNVWLSNNPKSNFTSLNILGMDFLERLECRLVVDMSTRTVTLSKAVEV